MTGVQAYDYDIVNAGTPQEYDSVTLNGHEFARITARVAPNSVSYEVIPTVGSQAHTVFRTRGSHHSAFEDCMLYAALEKLPEKFALEATE